MAKFIITAQIHVEGSEINSVADAEQAVRTMHGCYEDMDNTDTEIHVYRTAPTERVKA